MSLKSVCTYLHGPVTPHKKADPLVMSKRFKIAAVSLKKQKKVYTTEIWVLMHSGSQEVVGSVVMSKQGTDDVEEMDLK